MKRSTNVIDTILGSRFWALFQKEFAQIFRNRQLVIQLLVPPTVFLMLFGFALSPDFKDLKVGITDYDNSRASREFIEVFQQTDAFTISQYYANEQKMTADLAKGSLTAAITIPPEFADDIARKRTVQVQALFDAVDANTASIASSYLSQLVSDYNLSHANSSLRQNSSSGSIINNSSTRSNSTSSTNSSFGSGGSAIANNSSIQQENSSASTTNSLTLQTNSSTTNNASTTQENSSASNTNLPRHQVQVQTSVFYNPGLETSWFIVSGMFGIVLTTIGSQAAASLVVREKEAGTIEQLMMTPASNTNVILAKVCPLLILLTVDVLIALVVARLAFSVPLRGNLLVFLIIAVLYFSVCISIGILIATYSKSEQQTQLMAFFINPPLVLLCGATTPISSMPTFVQWLTYLDPLRYFVEVCRGVLLKGVGLETLWPQVLILLIFALVLMTLSIRQFRHQLS